MLVDVGADGVPRSVTGDPQHPFSRGFTCVRGRAAPEAFADPRRLDRPLRRVGERGSGEWRELGWDEALDEIAGRLLAIRDESGAEAVAYLNGTQFAGDGWCGYPLLYRFGSPNAGGTGLMCGGAQFAGGALTFGFASAFPDVVPGTTTGIVVWAQHPAASAPMYWARILEAVGAGAWLAVVDARPTVEARRADLWLAPRPGTDAALALALLHVLIADRLYDEAFVRDFTHGFDALARRVAGWTPERAEAETGVPAADVRRLAHLYAGGTSALSVGTPNGQGRNAISLERALCSLVALPGRLDRPGCNRLLGPTPDTGSEVTWDAYGELAPEQRRKRLGAGRFRLHDEGVEILSEAAERVWYGIPYPMTRRSLGIAHPLAVLAAALTGEPYPVRALLVQHHNALGAYPGSDLVARALRSPLLELVVVHELVMTPTAALADYVLPAASWLEKPFMISQGWGTPLVAGERAVAPLHERRSDYELCRDLGRRLGQEWPDRVEEVYDAWLAGRGTTFSELLASPERMLPGSVQRGRHTTHGFATPTGRIELASTVLERLGYDPLPGYEPVPRDRRFPLALMTGATRIDATHQDHRHVPSLRRLHPDPVIEVAPETAAEHGLDSGDWARIVTPRGEIRQRVRLVADLPRDRVNAERWWWPEGRSRDLFGVLESNVNAWTGNELDACDPAYGALPYRVAMCRLERVDESDESGSTGG